MRLPATLFLPALLIASALVSEPLTRAPAQTPAPASATAVTKGNRAFLQHLCRSPDARQVLVTPIHAGKMGLGTVTADGKDWKRLLGENEQPHFDGHWSPDGKKIVFVYDVIRGTDGNLQIDVMNADG